MSLRPRAAAGLSSMLLLASNVALVGAGAGQRASPDAPLLSGPTPYFVAVGSDDSGFRPGDQQLARWALDVWRRSAGPAVELTPAAEADAILRVYWAGPQEGQYGEMRPLIVGNRRGASVFIRPDMDALGAQIAARARTDVLMRDSIVYLTCLHEIGHAFGLAHTQDFRDIMYSFGYGGDILEYFERYRRQLRSRDDIARVSGLSTADAARIKTVYSR